MITRISAYFQKLHGDLEAWAQQRHLESRIRQFKKNPYRFGHQVVMWSENPAAFKWVKVPFDPFVGDASLITSKDLEEFLKDKIHFMRGKHDRYGNGHLIGVYFFDPDDAMMAKLTYGHHE